MISSGFTRRKALLAGAALLAMPAILRADGARLPRLVLQTPGSGPGILMAHARALGLFDAIADQVDLSIWTTGDEMRAGLVSGSVPVAVVPTQAAASLYNRGFGIKLVATLTEGHCGLVARGVEGCTIADLRGKSVVVPAFNDFTGHMMRLALAHHGVGLDSLTLIPATTHMEAAQVLLAGRADVALLAEPGATAALMRGRAEDQDLHRGVQMRDELGQITGLRPSLPQASLAMHADYAADHPWLAGALTEALTQAAEDLNANPAQAAENAAPFLERAAPLLAQAIPFAHINVLSAKVARPEVEALYQALIAADAGIIGGALPDDGLYAV
ncbi:ABC transporter substrate-binding protein [Roseinatronobacter sp. NSM]|uniref:ABC transporter substrate-binding protein n=1 Tax=Roseinatronobacter sp. NSM TaxID=3457785 RepID=UPI0040374739